MNTDKDDRPDWQGKPAPLRNFRYVGPLTPEASEWWRSFGRFLEAAQRNFDKRDSNG